MANRLIPANENKVKELKKLLPLAKNSFESKRIMIMCVYMWGKNIWETRAIMNVSSKTVEENVHRYNKDEIWFYKTHYTWRKLTKEREELQSDVHALIIESENTESNIDILDVSRTINRKYWIQKLDYHQARWLVRRALHANYQKPYVTSHKQSENAKELFEASLNDWVICIWSKTKTFDEESVKNKKTKFIGIIR